ncbi:MAG TPA: hypothetical protein VNT79_07575 [Phycisphaerae bacterium]|nr:hypothetical protein [Phycisphaerae bacterium]
MTTRQLVSAPQYLAFALATAIISLISASAAIAQTEACSNSNGHVDFCDDLAPSACVAQGGISLGPGTRCPVGQGTIYGNLNGDGVVDLLDVEPFALALVDPDSYDASFPDGNIFLADMNLDGLLNGIDIPPFVERLLFPPPCEFGRKYTFAFKPGGDPTGARARITTHNMLLCGEPFDTKPGGSLVFVTVTRLGSPQRWAQTGYARYRSRTPPHSLTVRYLRYAETKAGILPLDYEWADGPAPEPGAHLYDCHLLSQLFGTWLFLYDDELWHEFTRPGWIGQRGTGVEWTNELWNANDGLAGTPSKHCLFSQCQLAQNWNEFEDTNLTAFDLNNSDPNEYAIQLLSPTSFEIWDLNP